MRVAFISQPWDEVVPPVQGGSIQLVTYAFATRLAPHCEVRVYARQGRNQALHQTVEGVQYRRIPVCMVDRAVRVLSLMDRVAGFPRWSQPFFASPLYFAGYSRQVVRDLQKWQPDIVHLFNFSQFVPLVRRVSPQTRIVLHMQCEWLSQLNAGMIERRLRDVDAVISCSDYINDRVRAAFPALAGRCHTVYNGADTAEPAVSAAQSADEGVARVLFVARVSPEKGVHVLLEAFKEVLRERPETYLDIIGPLGAGPYEFIVLPDRDPLVPPLRRYYTRFLRRDRYVQALRAQLTPEVAKRVTLRGPAAHSTLAALYQRCAVFVFPSVWNEPFGMPIVEAMSQGCAVVTTYSGGIPELTEHEKTGLLVERGDPHALAQAILRLLRNAEERRAIGLAAQQRSEQLFDWDTLTEQLHMIYRRVLQQPYMRPYSQPQRRSGREGGLDGSHQFEG